MISKYICISVIWRHTTESNKKLMRLSLNIEYLLVDKNYIFILTIEYSMPQLN